MRSSSAARLRNATARSGGTFAAIWTAVGGMATSSHCDDSLRDVAPCAVTRALPSSSLLPSPDAPEDLVRGYSLSLSIEATRNLQAPDDGTFHRVKKLTRRWTGASHSPSRPSDFDEPPSDPTPKPPRRTPAASLSLSECSPEPTRGLSLRLFSLAARWIGSAEFQLAESPRPGFAPIFFCTGFFPDTRLKFGQAAFSRRCP